MMRSRPVPSEVDPKVLLVEGRCLMIPRNEVDPCPCGRRGSTHSPGWPSGPLPGLLESNTNSFTSAGSLGSPFSTCSLFLGDRSPQKAALQAFSTELLGRSTPGYRSGPVKMSDPASTDATSGCGCSSLWGRIVLIVSSAPLRAGCNCLAVKTPCSLAPSPTRARRVA